MHAGCLECRTPFGIFRANSNRQRASLADFAIPLIAWSYRALAVRLLKGELALGGVRDKLDLLKEAILFLPTVFPLLSAP